MESLGINPVQLIAQLINIGILFFVLKKFVYKPLLNLLESRRKTIEQGIKLSETMQKREEELEELRSTLTKKANSEAQKIKRQAGEEAKKQAEEIVEKAKQEAAKIKATAKESYEADMKRLEAKMSEEVVRQATVLANKALQELLDKETRAQLTEAQIKKIRVPQD